MSGLVVTFPPKSDESGSGYLRRLAVENGYTGWKSLLRAINVSPSQGAIGRDYERIAEALSLEPSSFDFVNAPLEHGAGLHDRRFQRINADPICPACLREAPYVRKAWSHSFVTACPTHGIELLDQCPSCGEPLENHRHNIAFCDCGYDLRLAPTTPSTQVHRWISARIAGNQEPIKDVAELGEASDYANLAKLLFLLAVRADPTRNIRMKDVVLPRTISEALKFLQPVVTILGDWPRSFQAHVAERLSLGNQRQFSLSGRLGHWYVSLNSLCNKSRAFRPVWRAFSDALIDHFDGNLRGDASLDPSPGKQRNYISVAEAAASIGTAHSTLTAAAKHGVVKAHITKRGVAYSLIMIERDEVARVVSARSKWIMESDAGEMLGVPASIVNGLKRAGILQHDTNWKADFLKGGPINVNRIFELIDQVREHMVERQVPETIPFSKLTGRRTTDGLAVTRLYQAIFSGDLRAVGHDAEHGLGGFLFATDEVTRYLGSAALNDGLTVTQVEKATGWKYESLMHWIDEELLATETVKLHGRPARIVSLAALMSFRKSWIPVSDLAQSIGTRSSALSKKLTAQGIQLHGQKTLSDGAKRGGLVALKDLAAILNGGTFRALELETESKCGRTGHILPS